MDEELIIKQTSIIYDESDLLSITKLKIISLEIKIEKEKLDKSSQCRYNFENAKNYMNNLTIINDFNSIIENLIMNNPYIKKKFIELI